MNDQKQKEYAGTKPHPVKCINCGAVLSSYKCEYCETEYKGNKIYAEFSKEDYAGTIKIGDSVISVYISDAELDFIKSHNYHDKNGAIVDGPVRKVRRFTLIEA